MRDWNGVRGRGLGWWWGRGSIFLNPEREESPEKSSEPLADDNRLMRPRDGILLSRAGPGADGAEEGLMDCLGLRRALRG